MGSSITRSSTKEKTDAVEILLLLARFLREKDESVEILDRLVSEYSPECAEGITGARSVLAVC